MDGAGTSTLVEGIADAPGVHVGGRTTHHPAGTARGDRTDHSDLGSRWRVVRSPGGDRQAFSLWAETVHRFGDLPAGRSVREADVVLLDEPESALSSANCLVLTAALRRRAADGEQVLCTTHSPERSWRDVL